MSCSQWACRMVSGPVALCVGYVSVDMKCSVVNSGVDVALVAEKLNSSSGEHAIHKDHAHQHKHTHGAYTPTTDNK